MRTGKRYSAFRAEILRLDDGANENEARVGGLALPYDTPTVLFEYDGVTVREKILESAVRHDERGGSYLLGHDSSRPVANTRYGTLTLRSGDRFDDEGRAIGRGLLLEANLDLSDPDSRSLATKVLRKDYAGLSVGFRNVEEDAEETRGSDGKLTDILYTVREMTLMEVSAVTWPAYRDTFVAARAEGLDNPGDRVAEYLDRRRRSVIDTLKAEAQERSAEPEQENGPDLEGLARVGRLRVGQLLREA